MEELLSELMITKDMNKDEVLVILESKKKAFKNALLGRLPFDVMESYREKLSWIDNLIAAIEISEGKKPSFGPNAIEEVIEPEVQAEPVQVVQSEEVSPVIPPVVAQETVRAEAASTVNASATTYTTNAAPQNKWALSVAEKINSKRKMLRLVSIFAAFILGIFCVRNFTHHFFMGVIFAAIIFVGEYFLFSQLIKLEKVEVLLSKRVSGYVPTNQAIDKAALPIVIAVSVPSLIFLVLGIFGVIIVAIYVCVFFFGSKFLLSKLMGKYTEFSPEVESEYAKIVG